MTITPAAAPTATTSPSISGAGTVADPLTVSPGAWSIAGLVFSYQWNDLDGAIAGATGSSLVLPSTDLRDWITVTVTATKIGYAAGRATAH